MDYYFQNQPRQYFPSQTRPYSPNLTHWYGDTSRFRTPYIGVSVHGFGSTNGGGWTLLSPTYEQDLVKFRESLLPARGGFKRLAGFSKDIILDKLALSKEQGGRGAYQVSDDKQGKLGPFPEDAIISGKIEPLPVSKLTPEAIPALKNDPTYFPNFLSQFLPPNRDPGTHLVLINKWILEAIVKHDTGFLNADFTAGIPDYWSPLLPKYDPEDEMARHLTHFMVIDKTKMEKEFSEGAAGASDEEKAEIKKAIEAMRALFSECFIILSGTVPKLLLLPGEEPEPDPGPGPEPEPDLTDPDKTLLPSKFEFVKSGYFIAGSLAVVTLIILLSTSKK